MGVAGAGEAAGAGAAGEAGYEESGSSRRKAFLAWQRRQQRNFLTRRQRKRRV